MTTAAQQFQRPSRDAWEVARDWLEAYGKAAIATVIATWGSAPVPAGGQLVVGPEDRFEGSVSGGCVEVDVLTEAVDAMADGKPRLLTYGVAEETAWRAGLPCGGEIKVLIEPLSRADVAHIEAIVEARRERRSVVATGRLADNTRRLYRQSDALPPEVADAFRSGNLALIDTPEGQVLVQPLLPPLRVIVAGATHIGQVFAELAQQVGYAVTVVDPRPAFANADRFGAATMLAERPEAAFADLGLDARTAVVALTHTAHIDDEALIAALRAPCLYIGALGSRNTHAKRVERLRAEGFTEPEIARIHAPIGIAIGAKGPAEIAVSILAQIIKVARGAA